MNSFFLRFKGYKKKKNRKKEIERFDIKNSEKGAIISRFHCTKERFKLLILIERVTNVNFTGLVKFIMS